MSNLQIPFLTCDTFEYDGSAHSPQIQGFDKETMTKSGSDRATKAGTYIIAIQLKNQDTNTWEDGSTDTVTLLWNITARELAKPFLDNDTYEYDGSAKTPDVTGFDPSTMLMSGDTTAVEVGEYVITYQLKDVDNNAWEDGTTGSVSLPWSIVSTSENNAPSKEKAVTLDQLGIVKDYIDEKVSVASDTEVEAMFPVKNTATE